MWFGSFASEGNFLHLNENGDCFVIQGIAITNILITVAEHPLIPSG